MRTFILIFPPDGEKRDYYIFQMTCFIDPFKKQSEAMAIKDRLLAMVIVAAITLIRMDSGIPPKVVANDF